MNSGTKQFNNGILNVINRCSYEAYIIKRNVDIICTCVIHSTSQADPSCPICLGTGHKITIRKVRLASQDTNTPPTFRSDNFSIARNFWIESRYMLGEDDLIVDGDSIYKIYEFQRAIGLDGTMPYIMYMASKKKFDSKAFMTNFRKIIKK